MNQSQAQIYKSAQRDCEESEVFRRLCTFNFGNYADSSRNPFGSLLVVNDETLGGRMKMVRHIAEDTDIILIPLVGGVIYKDSLGNEDIIETEQIRLLSARKGMNYQLENPYATDLINYLQVWLRPVSDFESQSAQQSFDLTAKNNLVPLFKPSRTGGSILMTTSGTYGFIGLYSGRKSGTYTLKNPRNGLFAFVLNGAFEFENRLLESRDGLTISKIKKADFEALSENALLLLLEVPMD